MTDNSTNTTKLPGAGGKMSFAVFCLILAAFFPVAYGMGTAWAAVFGFFMPPALAEDGVEIPPWVTFAAIGYWFGGGFVCYATARKFKMRGGVWFWLGLVLGGIAWAYCILVGWLVGKNPHILNHRIPAFLRGSGKWHTFVLILGLAILFGVFFYFPEVLEELVRGFGV